MRTEIRPVNPISRPWCARRTLRQLDIQAFLCVPCTFVDLALKVIFFYRRIYLGFERKKWPKYSVFDSVRYPFNQEIKKIHYRANKAIKAIQELPMPNRNLLIAGMAILSLSLTACGTGTTTMFRGDPAHSGVMSD